jgi:hypothetical protein
MSKEKVIELMELALKDTERIYNKVGEGELSFSEAGDALHTWLGDEVLTALSKALIYLKTEEE